MPDETTEQTASLESKLMASVEKMEDSGTAKPETKAAASDTKPEAKVEEAKPDAADAPVDPAAGDDAPPDAAADDTPPEKPDGESGHDIDTELKKHLPAIDDVPKELRPILAKKQKEMDAGFTRAMQEARAYRKEKAQYDADVSYRTEKPDQWLADFIQQNPSVIDKVNAELEKRADPTYAEAHAMRREAEKDRAKLAADREEQDERARADDERHRTERASHVEAETEASAKRNGIPGELVEEAVAAFIMASEERDISDADIERIVAAKAKVFNRHLGAAKGAKTKEYAKAKAEDAKGVTPKPRTGGATESTPPAKPKTLEEAINAALDRIESAA